MCVVAGRCRDSAGTSHRLDIGNGYGPFRQPGPEHLDLCLRRVLRRLLQRRPDRCCRDVHVFGARGRHLLSVDGYQYLFRLRSAVLWNDMPDVALYVPRWYADPARSRPGRHGYRFQSSHRRLNRGKPVRCRYQRPCARQHECRRHPLRRVRLPDRHRLDLLIVDRISVRSVARRPLPPAYSHLLLSGLRQRARGRTSLPAWLRHHGRHAVPDRRRWRAHPQRCARSPRTYHRSAHQRGDRADDQRGHRQGAVARWPILGDRLSTIALPGI